MKENQRTESNKFLTALTLGLIAVSLWIFSPYLHYLLVGAILALATSHVYNAIVKAFVYANAPLWLKKSRRAKAIAFLELFAGHFLTAVVILGFAWVVMGFLIDNILRLVFIRYLKRMFGFQYTMNENARKKFDEYSPEKMKLN